LAKIQANLVASAIQNVYSNIEIEHLHRETKGDIDLSTPLSKMPDQGVFTSDLRSALIQGEADLVVHSWKDLPIEMESGTEIISTISRADSRDILFLKRKSSEKKALKLYSSSPRRERNLSLTLNDLIPWDIDECKFLPIRGNIQTRFQKFLDDSVDGIVIAKAAIDRLSMDKNFVKFYKLHKEFISWMILPHSINPCAPGQGALAIEVAENNKFAREIASRINEKSIFESVEKEREVLSKYGGGCHQKIGVSIKRLHLGEVMNVVGLTEQGDEIEERHFRQYQKVYSPENISMDDIFPKNKEEISFFDREPVKGINKILENFTDTGIFVSRQNALPDGIKICNSNILWTSGLETWKKLASRGYWVNGSSDSLGRNNEKPCSLIENVKWINLTNDKGTKEKGIQNLVSYKLIPKELSFDLSDKKFFYWMSASSFEYALELYPKIIDAHHACGLGSSYDIISRKISSAPMPFVNFEDWKEFILNGKDEQKIS